MSEFLKNNIWFTKAVIIGSGMSGISASINFLKNNFNDFLIIEAENRIGGRCFTIDHGDGVLEFGAQFIHGQVDNPIYQIAKDNKLIDEKYNVIHYESDDELFEHNALKINISKDSLTNEITMNEYFLTQTGKSIPIDLVEILHNLLNRLIRNAESFGLKGILHSDKSVGSYLYENYSKVIENEVKSIYVNEKLNEKDFKNIIDGFFVWRCKTENLENGCDSVFDLSLNNFCQYKELKGSQIMEPLYGYKSIINQILSPYKERFYSKLKLNHSLKKIFLCAKLGEIENSNCYHCKFTNDKNKIVLIIQDEKKNEIAVICDNVICTMSLGYLKHNLANLIEPKEFIPSKKLESVSKLGFNAINKIFLIYDKPIWNEKYKNANGFYTIWLPEENQEPLVQNLSHHSSKKFWYENISAIEVAERNENVLICWISGKEEYEHLDDQTILKECTQLLRKFMDDPNFPEAKSILRSNWKTNKNFCGSYCYFPVDACPNDIINIAEPIQFINKTFIQFAGEHTHSDAYSTVHGAYLTGIRESERILKEL